MTASDYKIYVIDKLGNRKGEIDEFHAASLALRFNVIGAWSIDLRAGSTEHALLTAEPGRGLEFQRVGEWAPNGEEMIKGPMRVFERIYSANENLFICAGVGALTHIGRRRALPVVTGPPYTASTHDVRTGVGETVIKAYVDYNAGPNAQAARKVPGLTIEADAAAGGSVTGRARFDPLLKLIGTLAENAGGLGFKIVDMEFQVYEPQDKTEAVVFSVELGNLAEYSYRVEIPTGNYLIAGGTGSGTSRSFDEKGDSQSIVDYQRIENFLDYRNYEAADLPELLDAKLIEQGVTTALSITPVDTDEMKFMRDYQLGDTITVAPDGVPIMDVVREVNIDLSQEDGEIVTPIVGSAGFKGADGLSALINFNRDMIQRVDALERSE